MADAHRPTRHVVATATAALSTITIAIAAGAQPPVMSVRNTSPERPVAQDTAQWPIYYPHLAHRLGAAAATDEILLRKLLDLHSAMRYHEAADVAVRIVELDPDRAAAQYNLACMLARLRKTDEALEALHRAIAVGWRDRAHMALDPDLKIVRGDVRYTELVSQLQRLALQEHAGAGDPVAGDQAEDRGAAPATRPPAAVTSGPTQPQRSPASAAAPIILLVADAPPPSDPGGDPATNAAGRRSPILTMALTPSLARRLSAWLSERRNATAEAGGEPEAPRTGGWVAAPGSPPLEPAPAEGSTSSAEPADASAAAEHS